jgi:hypothetical protein
MGASLSCSARAFSRLEAIVLGDPEHRFGRHMRTAAADSASPDFREDRIRLGLGISSLPMRESLPMASKKAAFIADALASQIQPFERINFRPIGNSGAST